LTGTGPDVGASHGWETIQGLHTEFFGKTQNNFRLATGVVLHF
jgi:hypothetical protein